MKRSIEIQDLVKDLVKFQGEIKNPIKNAENPFYKGKKYSTLDNVLELVRPVLSKYNIFVYQDVRSTDIETFCKTILLHTTGQFIESSELCVKTNGEAQKIGGAITYEKRYQLTSVLGIASEDDDDGNSNVGSKEKQNSGYNSDNGREDKIITDMQVTEIIKLVAEKAPKTDITGVENWSFAKANKFIDQLKKIVKKVSKTENEKTVPVEKKEETKEELEIKKEIAKEKKVEEEVSVFNILKDEFKNNLE